MNNKRWSYILMNDEGIHNAELYLDFLNDIIDNAFSEKENTDEYKNALNNLGNAAFVESYFEDS